MGLFSKIGSAFGSMGGAIGSLFDKEKKGVDPMEIYNKYKPQYEALRGPGGELAKGLRMTAEPDLAGGFAERTRGTGDLERLRERGMAEGLSPEMQMMRQAEEQRAQEQGNQQRASAWGQMAQRGGLSGGARERLAGQAMQGTQRGLQNIGLQSGIESERQKLDLQKALPGMNLSQEQAILGAQQGDVSRRESARQGNINTRLADIQGKRDFEQKQFEERMKTYGAAESAK